MFKLVLEKAEEPEIKLPTSARSSKKQDNSRKTSISALLTMPKPLTVWITTNCGKLFKRWEYLTARYRHRLGRHADQADGEAVDFSADALTVRRRVLADFGQHHQPLGAASRIGGREYRDAAAAPAWQPAHRLLQFLRVEVAAAAGDDVLLAPGQEELAGRKIAEVAGIEPGAVEQAPVRFGILEIATGRRRPPELNAPERAFGLLLAARIDDAEGVIRQGLAAGNDALGMNI